MSRFLIGTAFLLASCYWSAGQTDSSALSVQTSGSVAASPNSIVGVPLLIKFGGVLKDTADVLPTTRTVQVTFSIFEDQEGGDPLWKEEQTVQVNPLGRYAVVLGSASSNGLPIDIFSVGNARWLEVNAEGYAQTPRTALLSVPYALKASDADTLAGKPLSAFVLTDQIPSLNKNIVSAVERTSTSVSTLGETGSNPSLFYPPPRFPGPIHGPVPTSPNKFLNRQYFFGGLTLSPQNAAPKNSDTGVSSSLLDLVASAFNSATKAAENETFHWQTNAVGSNSGNPSGQLSLLFGSADATPQPTGFSINADGTLVFATNQTVPLTVIQSALNDAGLSSSNDSSSNGPSTTPVVNTSKYSWQQTPGGTTALQVGANTVTLTPCPKGVNGTDQWHFLYISDAGTPEAILITGGSCVSGAPTGTVEFTAAYSHPATYKIESATGGVQEALNDAITPKSDGQNSRSVLIAPGDYLFHARLSIRASSVNVSVSGATITCAMQDTCIMLGDPSNSNDFQAITLDGLRVRPGIPHGTWTAVEDNAEGSEISNMGTASNPVPTNSFGHLVQVDNDQAAHIDRLTATLDYSWSRCDSSFCSSAIYGPGPPDVNAGVIWIANSNLSFQCGANGIDNFDGNTLHVSDSVVQGYTQFGVRSYAIYSDNPSVIFNNVYEEVGNCSNPLGTGIAGLIVMGGFAEVSGGTGPVGKLPQYANTGNIQYNYYVIVRSSTLGVSPAFLAGTATTNGSGPIPISWNQIGRQGTIIYDVLRTTGTSGDAPFGTGNFAVAVGVTTSSCSNQVCSFVDNAGSTPSLYTVAPHPNYAPTLRLWPGGVILTQIGDNGTGGGARYYSQTAQTSFVNAGGAEQPSVFAQECDDEDNGSAIWMQCGGGTSPDRATVLQLGVRGGYPSGLKGRLILETPIDGDLGATHLITLSDSNPAKTQATLGNRPTWDPTDTFIGTDQLGEQNYFNTQLSFGSPVSISNYIANVGDGINWLERLTANLKSFKVPVIAPIYQTASNCISADGTCGAAAAGMVAIAPGTTSVTVSNTAVTAKSEIQLDENLSNGGLMGVSCDVAWRHYRIASQTPGVGFVIETDAAPIAAACLSFTIEN